MKRPTPEFSRPLPVDRIPKLGAHEKIVAEPAECVALAQRLDIPALISLSATLKAEPWRGGGVRLTGEAQAELDQISVVSLDVFRSLVKFPVERYFLSPKDIPAASDDDIDVIDHGLIDLGEVISETLALELDPYPRQPGEVFDNPLPTDEAEAEEGPSSGLLLELAKLKKLKPES